MGRREYHGGSCNVGTCENGGRISARTGTCSRCHLGRDTSPADRSDTCSRARTGERGGGGGRC